MLRSIWKAALATALLLLLLYAPATAAQRLSIDFSSEGYPQAGVLHARQVEDRWTLCIPGTWDVTSVRVDLEGLEAFRAGELLIEDGATVDFSAIAGQAQKMTYPGSGNRFGTLTVYHGSQLPAIYFTVDADELNKAHKSKDYKVKEGRIVYVESDGSIAYDGVLDEIKGRGNSTFRYNKKPYQFKLDEKTDLSGMGKHKTWILLANYLDLSLLRNEITYDLALEMGIPSALETQQVDVYINGKYNGLYLLTEKVQVGGTRVDITDLEGEMKDLNEEDLDSYRRVRIDDAKDFPCLKYYEIPNVPQDVTGGYILEIEKHSRFMNQEHNGFKTQLGVCVTIKEPEACSEEQVRYVAGLFNDFHNAVHAKDGVSPDTGKHFSEYIDIPSFTAKYLIEELVKNYDALASSQYLYKDSDAVDGKLYFGPLWDYDLSAGNIQINGFISGSQPQKAYLTMVQQNTSLYWLLSRHEEFMDGVIAGFHSDLRPAVRVLLGLDEPAEDSRLCSIDEYARRIAASAQMNFSRWSANTIDGYYKKSGTTHEKSLAYYKDWIAQRLTFMEEMWPAE